MKKIYVLIIVLLGTLKSGYNSNNAQSIKILVRSFNAVSKVLYVVTAIVILLIIGIFNFLNIAAFVVANICILLLLALCVVRFLSKAHKAKPFVKEAEHYCHEYMYKEAVNLLQQAYTIYPNNLIKQDIEELTAYINSNNNK